MQPCCSTILHQHQFLFVAEAEAVVNQTYPAGRKAVEAAAGQRAEQGRADEVLTLQGSTDEGELGLKGLIGQVPILRR